jgi:hypothetical protein
MCVLCTRARASYRPQTWVCTHKAVVVCCCVLLRRHCCCAAVPGHQECAGVAWGPWRAQDWRQLRTNCDASDGGNRRAQMQPGACAGAAAGAATCATVALAAALQLLQTPHTCMDSRLQKFCMSPSPVCTSRAFAASSSNFTGMHTSMLCGALLSSSQHSRASMRAYYVL